MAQKGVSAVKPYYDHGGIIIYHGDAREVLPTLAEVGGVVTDPPYGMGRFETDGKDFLKVVGPLLRDSFSLVKDCGSMFVFMSTAEVINVANAVGAEYFKRMLWLYKPADCTFPLAGWLLKSEAILWFHKGGKISLQDRHPFRHDCYIHKRVGKEGVEGHPTVKPLAVVRDFVSRVDGITLDPFMGSGTTLVAAKELHQKAIGIEMEEKYCEIAVRRLAQEVLPL
jgi:site-specific DNA-methyltransferase (adenine-specific)